MELAFNKTGLEIKTAIRQRRSQLEERLAKRNLALSAFMADGSKLRSYLVRHAPSNWGHGREGYVLSGPGDISSEEYQEVTQLCQRIQEIEQELFRLTLISTHLADDLAFELNYNELISYGFDMETA